MAAPPSDPTTIASVGQFLGAFYPALGLAVGGMSTFLLIRPYFPDVFEPKRERVRMARTMAHEDMPPELPRTVWTWALLLWGMSEHDILRFVGADAYMFLRFIRMAAKVTAMMLVYGLCVLVPVNMYGDPKGLMEFEQYSMSNVQDGSACLWAHVVGAYLFTGLIMTALYKEYQMYVSLRQRHMKSPTVQAFSLVIRDIPSDADRVVVEKYLKNLLGEDTLALHMIEKTDKYSALINSKDKLVYKVEAAREKLANSGVRPTHKTGFLGLKGERVDSVDHYEQALRDVNDKLAQLECNKGEFQHAAVATFETVRVATLVRTVPLQQWVRFLQVDPAPNPSDLLWDNLHLPAMFRGVRSLVVLGAVFFLIFCYTIPVGLVASLANLKALSQTRGLEFLQPVVEHNPKFTSFLQGFVPPLVLAIFFSLVPTFMLMLARAEGRISESDAQRSAILKVFAFVLIDNFLAYTFAGAVLTKIDLLEHLAGHPVEIIDLLATTLPAQSTFFMNLIMIAAFNGLTMELLRLGPLVVTKLCRRLLADSKWSHLKILTTTVEFQQLYAFPLLVLLAGVCYSVLAPVILLFVLCYFAISYVVWLNQLLYVYNIPTNTGGTQWPAVFRCCMIILAIFQMLVTGVLGLKGMALATSLMLPLLAATLVFSHNIDQRFRWVGSVLTLENLLDVDIVPLPDKSREELQSAYRQRQDRGSAIKGVLGEGEDALSTPLLRALTGPYSVTADGWLDDLCKSQEELRKGDPGKVFRPGNLSMILEEEDEHENDEARAARAMNSVAMLGTVTEVEEGKWTDIPLQ